jgi:hypothetical protein
VEVCRLSSAIEMDVLVKSHSIHSKRYPEDPTVTVHTEISELRPESQKQVPTCCAVSSSL